MAALTAKRRNALPKTVFAIPAQRAYPIDTPARARSALARVAANGTPDEQAQVRRAVAKRYPDMDVTGAQAAKRKKYSNAGKAALATKRKTSG